MLFVSLQLMDTLQENHMSLVPSDMCFKGFQLHFVSNTSGTVSWPWITMGEDGPRVIRRGKHPKTTVLCGEKCVMTLRRVCLAILVKSRITLW